MVAYCQQTAGEWPLEETREPRCLAKTKPLNSYRHDNWETEQNDNARQGIRTMTSQIQVFADGQYYPLSIGKGMAVSFVYLPNGAQTRAGQEKHVPHATINQESGRVITASYQEIVGVFRKHIKTFTCPVFRRVAGGLGGLETYRVDEHIAQLEFIG